MVELTRSKSDVVRKSNPLMTARYRLSINQQRILHGLLVTLTPNDEDLKEYVLDVGEYAKLYSLDLPKNGDLYGQIEAALKGLVGNVLEIQEGKQTLVVSWLASARYEKGSGYAVVSFHPNLKPYLLQLKTRYTEYPLSAVAAFKSSHSYRFYEWLMSEKFKGRGGSFYKEISIDDLRYAMQIEKNEYKLFSDLRRFVIEPAMREITDKSDIRILSVDYKKSGRAVNSVLITAEPKIKTENTQENLPLPFTEEEIAEQAGAPETEVTVSEPSEQDLLIEELMKSRVSRITATRWVTSYGIEYVKRNLAYTLSEKKNGRVQSLPKYLAKSMSEDYAEGWEAEIIEKNTKKQAKIEAKRTEEDARERLIQEQRKETKRAREVFNGLSSEAQDTIYDEMMMAAGSLPVKKIVEETRRGEKEIGAGLTAMLLKQALKNQNIAF